MRLTPSEIEHIRRTGSYDNGQRTIGMAHFEALCDTALQGVVEPARDNGAFRIEPDPPDLAERRAARVAAHRQAEIERLASKIHAAGGQPSSLPIGQDFAMRGTFRVYFNRHQAAPLVWCVATDSLEIAVAELAIDAPTKTVYAPKPTPDHEDGKPSAWLEVTGVLVIRGKDCRITRWAE